MLDKLGSPNWKAEMRDNLGKNTGNRAQVALLLGTVIATGSSPSKLRIRKA